MGRGGLLQNLSSKGGLNRAFVVFRNCLRLLYLCNQVVLTASDPPGLWYAVNTLLQILRLFHGTGIPQVQVNDDDKNTSYFISLFFGYTAFCATGTKSNDDDFFWIQQHLA